MFHSNAYNSECNQDTQLTAVPTEGLLLFCILFIMCITFCEACPYAGFLCLRPRLTGKAVLKFILENREWECPVNFFSSLAASQEGLCNLGDLSTSISVYYLTIPPTAKIIQHQ